MGSSGSGSSQGSGSGTFAGSETQGVLSSLLFSTGKMKPPKRPLRAIVGDGFGKGRLKPDDSASAGRAVAVVRRQYFILHAVQIFIPNGHECIIT